MLSHTHGIAIKEFCSKFKSKTGTAWEKRDSIVFKVGKYTPVDMADDDDDDANDTPMPQASAAKVQEDKASINDMESCAGSVESRQQKCDRLVAWREKKEKMKERKRNY